MRLSLISLALTGLLLSGVRAASTPTTNISTLTLPGVARQDLKQASLDDFAQLVVATRLARRLVAPRSDDSTVPCARQLYYGLATEGQRGYVAVRQGLLGQGWTPLSEVRQPGQVAFQLKKQAVTLLGLWLDVPAQHQSGVVLCEQASAAPRTVVPGSPPPGVSPALGTTAQFTVQDWSLPPGPLTPILAFSGRRGGSGQVRPGGQASVSLQTPSADGLRPIGTWRDGFVLNACNDGSGHFTVSDPAVRFTTIHTFRTGTTMNDSDPHVSSAFADPGQAGGVDVLSASLDTPLVYTTGPVRVRGHQDCGGVFGTFDVDLNLPGGWTVVTHRLLFPRFGANRETLLNWDRVWNWQLTSQ